MAQVVPDICPREKEFVAVMREVENGLLKVVHADPEKYVAVLFCGSGTINMDICLNSLLPENKKVLIINNGAYSRHGMEICEAYGCFLQAFFGQSCKTFLDIVACPNWTKLQSVGQPY